ncbi:MAG: hypothetical protein ACFFCO_06015 [Promethearchaeota archaeon]
MALIHQVYIISKNGPLLFERTFIKGRTSADPDLSSGLITALYHFTKDTMEEMINSVTMEDVKLVFDESETIIFAATVDTRLPDRDAMAVMARVRDYWILHYGEHKEGAVDRSRYTSFGMDVERIIVDNLWWLGEGRKFSIRNQFRYLKETISRPSRCVGARYLGWSYVLTPILIAIATLLVSYYLGGQVIGWTFNFIDQPLIGHLITMSFNIFSTWLIMPIMTAAINGKLGTLREIITSTGYAMIFQLGLFIVASRTWLILFLNPLTINHELGIFSLQTAQQKVDTINSFGLVATAIWQLPATVLLFAWLVLYAYITFNIQRPKALNHVVAVGLSFVFLNLVQSLVYLVFLQTFPLQAVVYGP